MRLLLAVLALAGALLIPATSSAWIWADPARLAGLDTTGAFVEEWKQISATARVLLGRPNVSGSLVQDTIPNLSEGQDDRAHVMVLAKAIYYAKTGNVLFKNETERMLMRCIGSEFSGGTARTLDLGRYIPGYVMAYDIIGGLSAGNDTTWTRWLYNLARAKSWASSPGDGSLMYTARFRANNWGAFAISSLAAVATLFDQRSLYTDSASVWKDRAWDLYQDYIGRFPRQMADYSTSAGFSTSDPPGSDSNARVELYAPKVIRAATPYHDSLRPVNPACLLTTDATSINRNLDGAMVEDLGRNDENSGATSISWPLDREAGVTYAQGSWIAMVTTAELLFNGGRTTAYTVQNEAVRRMTDCFWRLANDVQGTGSEEWWPDDVLPSPRGANHQSGWAIPLVNKRYGTSYPWNQPSGGTSAGPGGFCSGRWVAWTHQLSLGDAGAEVQP